MGSIKEVKNDYVRWLLSGEVGDAEARAVRLLLAHLNPRQRKRYLREGEFVVRGSGRGRYVLRHGRHGRHMVRWLPLWPIFPSLRLQGCLQALGAKLADCDGGESCYWRHNQRGPGPHLVQTSMPQADQLLALKLLLETDEKHFRATTNW